jgi:hypothetical protein
LASGGTHCSDVGVVKQPEAFDDSLQTCIIGFTPSRLWPLPTAI